MNYKDLENLSAEEVGKIKRRGSVVIKDIVDDQKAIDWRESLREFVKVNPVEGKSVWTDEWLFVLSDLS